MIKILVCLKQVAYLYSRMGMDSKGKIDPDGVVYIPNPYDEAALEEALRMKEAMDHAVVTLISMGPPSVENALLYGLAMGADRAVHLCDERLENMSPRVRCKALVEVIKTQGFDLILCGRKAIDDNGGVVGGLVAELLGLPFVSSVTEIGVTPDGKKTRMYQVLERGDRQIIECDLPALLSVEKGMTRPRYPTFMGRILASGKKVFRIDPGELGISSLLKAEPEMKVSRLSISRPKPKKAFAPDSGLSPEERIRSVMSGGLVERKSRSMKASPQELAQQFINFLEESRIIKKR